MMFKAIMKNAIDSCNLVILKFNSKEKGIITRRCVPFDIGPRSNSRDKSIIYFHFYDLDSPEGNHNLSILPDNILNLEITGETFKPSDYVKWTTNWIYKRNWGIYS